MDKRGQLTVFIILGLVLLLTAGLVFYFITEKEVKPIAKKVQVPTEIVPVYNLISSCMYDLAQRALTTLGLQGGYLYIPPRIERNPFSYVAFDPLGILKVPYWYYEGEDRSPNVIQMERDVSKFVNDNLRMCVNNFTTVANEFTVAEKGEIELKTTFTDEDVFIEATWPLDVSTFAKTVRQQDFVSFLPVKVKKMFELANSAMKEENKLEYFENLTMKLILADPDMPHEGMEFSCNTKRWHINDVKERLQSVLYHNIPRVRLRGTDIVPYENEDLDIYEDLREERQDILEALTEGVESFTPPDYTPEDAFEYFSMTFDVNYPAKDLKAGFQYNPVWNMLLNIHPNDGGTLKTNMAPGNKKYLKFLCINQWHFTYDLIYPIIMTINDPSAFNDRGYIFQMAFPVIINDNDGERVNFGLKRFESIDFYSEVCNTKGEEEADIRVKGFAEDSPFAVELNEANITFKCVFEECLLGKTSNIGGVYRWKDKLPPGCINPIITASKEGYLSSQKQLTSPFLELLLTKLKPIKFSVVKHIYQTGDKKLGEEMKLEGKEQVSMYLFLRNHAESIIKEFPTKENMIELPYSDYSYDLNMVLKDNFGTVLGGLNIDNLNISYGDMADKNEIVFHVVQVTPPPKTNQEKFEFFNVIYGGKLADKLKPTFK